MGEMLVDPRGPRLDAARVALAARRRLEGETVVVYDNGKCHPELGSYRELLEEVNDVLRSQGARVVEREYQDPVHTHLHPDEDQLPKLAQEIVAERPAGVVLALGDAGVSNPTVRLALAIEEAGAATVSLFTPLGIQVAHGVAAGRAPDLPMLVVEAPWTAPPREVRAEARRLAGALVAALTDQPTVSLTTAARGPEGEGDLACQNPEGLLPWMKPEQLLEQLTGAGLGDGLPVLLPTPRAVSDLLETVPLDPGEVVMPSVEPLGSQATLRTVAANAALAGCRPAQFPIVVAACMAISHPRYRPSTAPVTTHGSGHLIIVSGPYATEAGINASAGCLGPGAHNRANLAIGRTLNLVGINVGRAALGQGDLCVMGTPAKISYCFAESPNSPWPGLNAEFGNPDATSVTVLKCEGPHNILDQLSREPEALLRGFALAAATGASNNTYAPAEMALILNHQHARLIADAGWSKRDVQRYIFETARVSRDRIVGRGIRSARHPDFDAMDPIPVVPAPENVYVTVAGGLGVQSAIALPWGYNRAVTVPLVLGGKRY